jgi:hypothetical protein
LMAFLHVSKYSKDHMIYVDKNLKGNNLNRIIQIKLLLLTLIK